MTMFAFRAILLTLLVPMALAGQLHLTTPSTLPPLPPSTRALLTRPSFTPIAAPVTTINDFVFRNLTSGIYDLTIDCRDYDFERDIIVEVDDAGRAETFRVGDFGTGAKTSLVAAGERVSMEIKAIRRKEFYEERVGFSPLDLLKNPMILIAVVGLGFVIGMPYLLDSMDPETRAEFEEQQKKSVLTGGASAANPLQNFDMAAWMAGKTSGGEARGTSKEIEDEKGGGSKRKRG